MVGLLVRRDLFPGPSKFGGRSYSIRSITKHARVHLSNEGEIDTPSIAPSSLRNIAARDCASSAAKYLKKKLLWSENAHVNVRHDTSEMVVVRENLDNSRQLQASQYAASPRHARAHPWSRFQNAPEFQENQMHPLIPGLTSSLAQCACPSGHQGGTAG